MELYLLRHGDAVDRGTGGYERDEERPLTDEGRMEARHAARALLNLGVGLDLLLTSPLTRAGQTAAIAAEILRPRLGAHRCEALAPGGAPEAVLAAITGRGDYSGVGEAGPGRVLLVGHMPDLGELAGWLVWGRADLPLALRTGGLCRIDLPTGRGAAGSGDLRWLLPPRLLRRLA
ncbi:MAG: histidine phosphatase family protein [Chloroflexota bacterium]|nr:histidine phosphatase family protein [Chloroflexota bacterium]